MSFPKRTPYRNKKYLQGAKGEECTFGNVYVTLTFKQIMDIAKEIEKE